MWLILRNKGQLVAFPWTTAIHLRTTVNENILVYKNDKNND